MKTLVDQWKPTYYPNYFIKYNLKIAWTCSCISWVMVVRDVLKFLKWNFENFKTSLVPINHEKHSRVHAISYTKSVKILFLLFTVLRYPCDKAVKKIVRYHFTAFISYQITRSNSLFNFVQYNHFWLISPQLCTTFSNFQLLNLSLLVVLTRIIKACHIPRIKRIFVFIFV